jgi:hypothetical protein
MEGTATGYVPRRIASRYQYAGSIEPAAICESTNENAVSSRRNNLSRNELAHFPKLPKLTLAAK